MQKPPSPSDVDSRVAANVKRLRESRDMSRADLAKRVTAHGLEGIHQTTIARIESLDENRRPLRVGEAFVFATALNVDVEALWATDSVTRWLAEAGTHEAERASLREMTQHLAGMVAQYNLREWRWRMAAPSNEGVELRAVAIARGIELSAGFSSFNWGELLNANIEALESNKGDAGPPSRGEREQLDAHLRQLAEEE